MKRISLFSFGLLLIFAFGCQQATQNELAMTKKEVTYPIAEKKDSVLTTNGDSRVDPYFWMRLTDEQKVAKNPDAQTQQVLNYLEGENAYTSQEMKDTEKLQETLYNEIVGRIKQDDESVPYFQNKYWYYTRYEEGQEYPIYCRKKGSLDAAEEIILDVNKEAEGYEYYSVRSLAVSRDNKILAFNQDTLSRRIFTIRFKNLETGEYLEDEIPNSDGGGAWANDNQTFFYTRKNKVSLLSEKIARHSLGTDASKDVVVYEEKDPSFYIGVSKSKSSQYLIISNTSTLVSDYYILNADDPMGEFQQFSPREDRHEYSIDHFEDKFYVVTNWDAENFRLMETPVTATAKENWKEVIPHRPEVLLRGIDVFQHYLVISERSNALTHLKVIDQRNQVEHYLKFEEEAYVVYSSNNLEFDTKTLRFGYSSLTTPISTYDYDMETQDRELKKQQEIVGGHNSEEYDTERFFVTARDGAEVPVSLVYKKGMVKNGNAPLLLYSYGSYGSSTDPWFSSINLSLLNRGFIYAIAHIRGGQEMGRKWYEDGKMFKKKNTFYDYIDCAKYLIDEKYTSADHLYGYGGSAGGLLMGAVSNLAPELFNGIIAEVPFVDVVSTMLDESIPLTTNEFDEWGNPKNLESYQYMLSYSPYDQVAEQDYPNMLVTTGLFDSQVQYWEPAKWVAKLRDKKTDDNLLLLHTNMGAGHGGASGRFKRYKDRALNYAFLLKLEGIEN
ncbi:MAG: S9 family peptidase [Cytophagales bacterium]|nr:S9 family peptidase [Cytophagales bacterium]